jgi:hypothetical protein
MQYQNLFQIEVVYVRFEVLTAVNMTMLFFWVVTL